MTTSYRKLAEPLETMTSGCGLLLILGLVFGIVAAIMGWGSFGGFGRAVVCATNEMSRVSGFSTRQPGIGARPGAYLSLTVPITACTSHPSFGQRLLLTLTRLPTQLVWAGILLLLWRMLRVVGRRGPFSPQVAAAMRVLGWFVLAGTLVATVIQGLAADQLLNTMLVHDRGLGDALSRPLSALPVAALAGVGLLILARFIRLGVSMDEEIKGTV